MYLLLGEYFYTLDSEKRALINQLKVVLEKNNYDELLTSKLSNVPLEVVKIANHEIQVNKVENAPEFYYFHHKKQLLNNFEFDKILNLITHESSLDLTKAKEIYLAISELNSELRLATLNEAIRNPNESIETWIDKGNIFLQNINSKNKN
jgi:hypothetical protein